LRILLVTDSKKVSGGVKQLYYSLLGLSGQGHDLFLAARENAVVRELAAPLVKDFLPLDFADPGREAETLGRFCRERHVEVVHTFHTKAHKLAVRAKHGCSGAKLFVNRGVSFMPHNPYYVMHPGIDGFICNSQHVAKVLRRFWVRRKKLHVIYNAYVADEGRFHHAEHPLELKPGVKIITVSSGSKWKGLDVLLEACNRLADADASFYVIGVREPEKFKAMLTPEALARTAFLGRRRDVPELLAQMDIFALAPRGGESCPNVILEAFAAGLPVAATAVGGIPELIRDGVNGFTVAKGRPDLLAGRLRQLLADRALGRRMGGFNRKFIGHFSLERKIANLVAVYQGGWVTEKLDFG